MQQGNATLCSDQAGSNDGSQGHVIDKSSSSGKETRGTNTPAETDAPKHGVDWEKNKVPKWNLAVLLLKVLLEVKRNLGSLFLQFLVPVILISLIYKSHEPKDFKKYGGHYWLPGAVLSIIFYTAMINTSWSFASEREKGLLQRIWVAGMSSLDMILAHLIVHLLKIGVQIILMLFLIRFVHKIPIEGSLALEICLILLQGVTGMFLGMVISTAVKENQIGLFLMNLSAIFFISGFIRVVEIPYPINILWLAMPQTYASEALRSMMFEGYGLLHKMVWPGFAVTLTWIAFLFMLTIMFLKVPK